MTTKWMATLVMFSAMGCLPEIRVVPDAARDASGDVENVLDLPSASEVGISDAGMSEGGVDHPDGFVNVADAPDTAVSLDVEAPQDRAVVDVLQEDVLRCQPPTQLCDGGCTNVMEDALHCGACGRACTASQRCEGGQCMALRCPPGMALLPAGSFTMGSPTGTGSADEHPAHLVRVDTPFCIDIREVTHRDYEACRTAGQCPPVDSQSSCRRRASPGEDQFPAICVTWSQALAYCMRRQMRLPTEAEWEYAARGSAGRLYPWGDAPPPDDTRLCWSGGFVRDNACAVDFGSAGQTPEGIQGMAGNVQEWVMDAYMANTYATRASTFVAREYVEDPSTEARVARGGSYGSTNEASVRGAARNFLRPSSLIDIVGFRCRADVLPR